uniref:Epithelial cell adhesion molecule n=1 Tax=Sinocyclocheilus anshuiensis TaxID=1608454 RepID=A0A671K325_9TELE
MKVLIALFVVVLVDVVASQCKCFVPPIKCSKCLQFSLPTVIPKCFLIKAEMYRARNNVTTRSIGGKSVETAFVDNDGIYDPECESDGKFKAIQCNGTDVCWGVNSAGVRRSDKGDKNIKCEPVETYWVRLELKHKANDATVPLDATKLKTGIENALLERYKLDKKFVSEVKYDRDGRLIVVDVKKPEKERITDLSLMTYYMEGHESLKPLFQDYKPFEVSVEGSKVSVENILLYYVDEVVPTFTMQSPTDGIIAVIVVVSLIVIAGLLVLFFLAQRQKAQYSKA